MSELHQGDVREVIPRLESERFDLVLTSPPYWRCRDYGVPEQIGLEADPDAFIETLAGVMEQVKRVLKPEGVLVVVMGDSFNGKRSSRDMRNGSGEFDAHRPSRFYTRLPERPLIGSLRPGEVLGIPWRLAFRLQSDGWFFVQDLIWAKPNPYPHPVRGRLQRAHEYVFVFSKDRDYYFDRFASLEPSVTGGRYPYRLRRSVIDCAVSRVQGHGATFPEQLASVLVQLYSPVGGWVLDPFCGTGTTLVAAEKCGRHAVGIEIQPRFVELAKQRVSQGSLLSLTAD